MTGFVRVLGNLGVLVFWIILAANFISANGNAGLAGQAGLRGRVAWAPGAVPGAKLARLAWHGRFSERPCCAWSTSLEYASSCWP